MGNERGLPYVPPPFTCSADWVGEKSAVLTISGELDLHTAQGCRGVLDGLDERGIDYHLVVDLSDCTFMDSTGLGLLVTAQRRASSRINVVAADHAVRHTMMVSGLDQLFVYHDNRVAALRALWEQFGDL